MQLAKLDSVIIEEFSWRQLQIRRSRSQANAARSIVVRAMTGTEPATVVSTIRGDAAEMRADADVDQPLGSRASLAVELWVLHCAY